MKGFGDEPKDIPQATLCSRVGQVHVSFSNIFLTFSNISV